MLVFHPVRVGMLETLNWSATFSSNMQKHAGLMVSWELFLFCTLANMTSAVFICTVSVNGGKIAKSLWGIKGIEME